MLGVIGTFDFGLEGRLSCDSDTKLFISILITKLIMAVVVQW